METCASRSTLREPFKDPVDVIIRKLERNDDSSLKSIAMQRLQKFSTTALTLKPKLPTYRLFQALSVNKTVESLELWIPEYDTDSCETFHGSNAFLSVLTEMLARNQTIRRLTILPFSTDSVWNAILKGLQENVTVSHLIIEATLPVCGSHYFAFNDSITSLSINRYWSMTPSTTSTDAIERFFLDLRGLKPLRLLEINNFEADHILIALKAMNGHPGISKLELINCDLSTLDSFPVLPLLIHLRLIDCQLTEGSLLVICKSVSIVSDSLELLDLRGNSVFSLHSACTILNHHVLSRSTKLAKLVLELCEIDDIGLDILCGSGLCAKIHSINLRENRLVNCDVWSNKFINAEIADMDLSDNRIGLNAKALDTFVRYLCRSVKRLQVESCHLSATSIEQLCLILRRGGSQLRDLNLSHNDAVAEAAFSIAEILSPSLSPHNERVPLESVSLSSCRLSDAFMETLCTALSIPGSTLPLQNLNLSCNEISNVGIEYVAKMLEHVPNGLKKLDLQSNIFDKDGLEVITESIAENCFDLTEVRLSLLSPNDRASKAKLVHWLLLNRAGRNKIASAFVNTTDGHDVDWPSALAEANDVYGLEAIYYLVRHCPSIVR